MAQSVAVLGTGIMGAAMARNLLAVGMEVRVWNRTRGNAEPLGDQGAAVADHPAGAVSGAKFVLTVFPDAETTELVLRDGALEAFDEHAIWIQSGTVGTDGSDALGELAATRGVGYVDAPVLGTKAPAEAGELFVLGSGPEELREPTRPVFDAIGKRTLWVGAAGMGSKLKLVTNDWIVGLLATLGETLALAGEIGVDPKDFLAAIEGGPLDSGYAQLKSPLMMDRDYPPSAPLKHIRKDARLVARAAGTLPSWVADAAARYFDAAMESGHADDDMAAIHEGVLASRAR